MREIALFEEKLPVTPIYPLSGAYSLNRLYVKRDDLLPFSFGGNKLRKAKNFYEDIKRNGADVIMTYGANSSNHCRIIADMAAAMGLLCHIISPEENQEILNNTFLVKDFGAKVETCPVTEVSQTIENRKKAYEEQGLKPYFIMGGGHGNLGTRAYVEAYNEIVDYEKTQGSFDYIFHASGTGTTQAGLVCGKLLHRTDQMETGKAGADTKIVGISIARNEERGRQVVKESIQDYLGEDFQTLFDEKELTFTDAYIQGGYGKFNQDTANIIKEVMKYDGIPMDTTYVGKAFNGMLQYLKANQIENKKVLFIHTGGTPLYFDNLKNFD